MIFLVLSSYNATKKNPQSYIKLFVKCITNVEKSICKIQKCECGNNIISNYITTSISQSLCSERAFSNIWGVFVDEYRYAENKIN